MDLSSHYQLPSSINASFQKEIDTYNNQEVSADVKTKSLEIINAIVQGVLSTIPSSQSQEAAQEVKDLLKQIKVQPEDHNLWNQIMGEIDKASPTIRSREMLPNINIRSYEVLDLMPTEIYRLLMEKTEGIERRVESMELLEKCNSGLLQLSLEQRFQLALQCGEEVTRLNLFGFQEGLDNEKLKQLQEACPNLRELGLSGAWIEELDLSIFSKLEFLDASETDIDIETLDKLPKSLKVLNLSGCPNIRTEEIQKLKSLSKLERLNLTSTDIQTLEPLPTSLKTLYLNLCRELTAEAFQKLASFDKLELLDVGATLIETLDPLPNSLKYLNLEECDNLTADELQKLASFEKLQLIHLPMEFKNGEIAYTLRKLNKEVV